MIHLLTMMIFHNYVVWLVVSTPLKNIRQLGPLSPTEWKKTKCSKPPISTPNCRHFSSLRLNPGAARARATQQGRQLEQVSSRDVGCSKVLGRNKVGTQSASYVCWSRNPLNITYPLVI